MIAAFGLFWLLLAAALGLIARGTTAERGMAALVRAYRDKRPLEPRLSGGFSAGVYDPAFNASTESAFNEERNTAAELLADAAADRQDGYAQLAYGRFLLTEERTLDAMRPLRRAAATMPSSAEARNDLAVCLMEQQLLEDALEQLDQALQLDAGMPEAWFNRSLCYQRLLLMPAARDALAVVERTERDPGWRQEVRRLTEGVNESESGGVQESDVVAAFDAAFSSGALDEARRITNSNLEIMIKHVSSRVIRDYLKTAIGGDIPAAGSALRELEFVGNELSQAKGDWSVNDLASYLEHLSDAARISELASFGEYDRAVALRNRSRMYPEARAMFEQLAHAFGARGNEVWEVVCTEEAASCDYSMYELSAGAAKFEKAMALLGPHRWPYRRAQVATMLGVLYSRLGRGSLGIRYCQEALQFAAGLPNSEAKALQYLSLAHFRMGDFTNRLRYLRESTRLFLFTAPSPRNLASNYYDMAGLYSLRGNHALALLYARESLRYADRSDDYNKAAQDSALIAVELGKLGQFERADDALKQALQHVEKIGEGERLYTGSQVFRRGGELALTRRDWAQALEYYGRAEDLAKKSEDNQLALIRVLQGRAEAYAASGQVEKACADLQKAADQLNSQRAQITERTSRSEFLDANYAVFDRLVELKAASESTLSDAFDALEQSRSRALLDDLGEASSGESAGPLTLARLPGLLPDNVRLLEYAVTSQRTYIFVVTRAGREIKTSPATTESLDRLVHEYVQALKTHAPLDELKEKARLLYRQLIEPVEEWLGDGKKLCIIPDKALHFLPFAALLDGSNKYLVQSYDLSYAPSASVLVRCIDEARKKTQGSRERILAVGNPRFNRAEFSQLADLADAEEEALESVAAYGGGRTLVGPEATKRRLLAELRDCDVAHLALHCLVEEKSAALVLADDSSEESTGRVGFDKANHEASAGLRASRNADGGLSTRSSVTSDRGSSAATSISKNRGLLYLDEIYRLDLPRTRLVVLSACQSGLGQYYRGEGIVSLVRPFLALRVPMVVASLWSVDSSATATLMINFHQQRKAGKSGASEALRAAQIAMLERDPEAHPYYWAPFITVGFDR